MTETEIIVLLLAFMVLVSVVGGIIVIIRLVGIKDANDEVNNAIK